MADAAADKAAFFEHLYALNDTSDEEDDVNDSRSFFKHSAPNQKFPTSTSSHQSHNIDVARTPVPTRRDPVLRTASEPTPSRSNDIVIKDTPPVRPSHLQNKRPVATTPLVNIISLVEDTPLKHPGHTRSNSSPMPTNTSKSFGESSKANTLGRRKRKGEPSLVSEDRRIFKGLNFFYLPNDDIAPARKIRITKAREHGANWARAFDNQVSHVIADRKLSFKDILTYFKIQALPSHIVLTNDDYPIECIQFKALLDPSQKHYQVSGFKEAIKERDQAPRSSGVFESSLQLKPPQSKPGKWNYVPPANTPPRSEESTQKQANKQVPKISSVESSPGVWVAPVSNKNINNQPSVTAESANEQPQVSTVPIKAKSRDALDDVIDEVQKIKHLPLSDDDDDDEGESESQHDKTADGSEDERSPAPVKNWTKKAPSTAGSSTSNFSCMTGGTGKKSATNPNARTIEILQEMANHYDQVHDNWRTNAYRRVITILGKQPTKITTAAEAFRLPYVGQRIANKIEEIVTTDSLQRLKEAKLDPSEQIVKLFMGIYGVGHSQATKWMHQGYKTLDDLLHNVSLSENQRIGIEHYTDFATRIPRAEVTALGDIVTKVAHDLDSDLQVIIGGSYRRGAADSGDIDFILTKPDASISTLHPLLHALVTKLSATNFLVAALAVPRNEGGSKWHGACALPTTLPNTASIWRRIDFLLVPAAELGAALIYFTGNDIFNRSLRLLASKKGMRLNQRGLYRDVMRGPGRVKMNEGELVEGRDERNIFEVLGVPWREPCERIC